MTAIAILLLGYAVVNRTEEATDRIAAMFIASAWAVVALVAEMVLL